MISEYLIIILLGAVCGSFLNVLIIRGREKVTILGRSRCLYCEKKLKPQHLVPVLSWLMLRGRCVYCQRPIHIQYPLVELLSACLFIFIYIRHPFFLTPAVWPSFLFESLFLLTLLALVVFDFRWKLLPIEPIIVVGIIGALWKGLSGELPWTSILLGILATGLFLGLQVILSQGRWMGGGDPWLGMFMGAWLGWPQVGIALYMTYVGGGLCIGVLWLLGIIKRGAQIPFAPLLALGTLGALIFGDRFEAWARFLL